VPKHLDDLIAAAGSPVRLLRDSQSRTALAARLPAEFTNWRDEQRSWRHSAVLFTQSHHMADLVLRGTDARRLVERLAVNSVADFPVDMAKQFVAVGPDGHLIGDNIMFHTAEDEYHFVGLPPTINWIEYQAQLGGDEVELERDDDSSVRRGDPRFYRYQVQGPRALEVMAAATGAAPPQLRFFQMTRFTIGGKPVRALRHGMVGTPGFELWGPWQDDEAVLAALLAAGEPFGMRRSGAAAYHTNTLESGWLSRPVPAIYTDPALADYRAWLPADSYEATAPLGGSLDADDIADFYLSPYDVGYGRIVSFDHDFIGRAALQAAVESGRDRARRKVTLVWDGDDVERAVGSMFHPGLGAKHFNLPLSRYADFQHDRVLLGAETVGMSTIVGYSANFRAMLSLAVVDAAVPDGAEVRVVWGEDPLSHKLQVEAHRQVEIRARVAPAPLDDFARGEYRRD